MCFVGLLLVAKVNVPWRPGDFLQVVLLFARPLLASSVRGRAVAILLGILRYLRNSQESFVLEQGVDLGSNRHKTADKPRSAPPHRQQEDVERTTLKV